MITSRILFFLLLLTAVCLFCVACGFRLVAGKRQDPPVNLPFLPDLPGSRAIGVDDGFVARNFVVPEDRNHVFLLTFGLAGTPDHMPYRLLKLDSHGTTLARLELPGRRWVQVAAMWWNGPRLHLMMEESVLTIDTQAMRVVDEVRLIHAGNFLPRRKLDEMIPKESEEAYAQALQRARASYPDAAVVTPPKGRAPYVVIAKSAWVIPVEEAASRVADGAEPLEDGPAKLACEDSRVVKTALRYPRFVEVKANAFTLTNKEGRRLRFQTTDDGSRELEVFASDDRKLTTKDGAIWLRYEKRLYRIAPAS